MTLAAEIARLEGRRPTELPLDVQLVLDDIRSLPVIIVDQRQRLIDANQWRRNAALVISNRQDRILPRQLVRAFRNRKAAHKVAAHVKHRVADVLRKENSGAGPQGPFGGRTPRDPETRREIAIIRLHQPVTQASVPRDRDGWIKPDRHAL